MLSGGTVACGLGLFETAIGRIESGGNASGGLSHESQLPPCLRTRSDRRSLSGRCMVSQLYSPGPGADYSGTFDRWTDCGGIRICEKSFGKRISNPALKMKVVANMPSPHPDPLPSHPMGRERGQQLDLSLNSEVGELSPGPRALLRFDASTLQRFNASTFPPCGNSF